MKNARDNSTGTIAVSKNTTIPKDMEQSLQEYKEEYKILCLNVPGMIYRGRSDWSTTIICGSDGICGYSTEEFNSRKVNWLDIIHPDDRERVLKEASKLEKGHVDIVQEYRIIHKNGGIRWIKDHKTSMFTREGIFKGVSGIAFDITEYKKLEDRLKT